jgi:hypothetical protein
MNVQTHPEANVLQVLLVGPRVAKTVTTVPVDNLPPVVQPAACYYIGWIFGWCKICLSLPSTHTGP